MKTKITIAKLKPLVLVTMLGLIGTIGSFTKAYPVLPTLPYGAIQASVLALGIAGILLGTLIFQVIMHDKKILKNIKGAVCQQVA